VDIADFIQDSAADMGLEGLSGHKIHLFPENFPQPVFELEEGEEPDRAGKIDQHIDIAPLPRLPPDEGTENADFGYGKVPPQLIQVGLKGVTEVVMA
jgi:hypothetical protein